METGLTEDEKNDEENTFLLSLFLSISFLARTLIQQLKSGPRVEFTELLSRGFTNYVYKRRGVGSQKN